MVWRVSYSEKALKLLKKLDKPLVSRILKYMDDVSLLSDPRQRGKSLTGNLDEYWRYRVGEYRILCNIDDGQLVVLVVSVGKRDQIYARQ